MKKKMRKKEIPQKVAAGVMSGVMLLSSTGTAALAQEIQAAGLLNGDDAKQIEKGISKTQQQAAPALASRTDTTVTLNSTVDSFYAYAKTGEQNPTYAWTKAIATTISFDTLQPGVSYDFVCAADDQGTNMSPASTIYTLQAAPTNPSTLATLTQVMK